MNQLPAGAADRPPGDGDLRGTYVAVLLFEALVLLALWAFSAYFA